MLLSFDLCQHCLFYALYAVLDLFCEGDLLDVLLELLLVVGLPHLVYIISEELLLEYFEDGGQHLHGLGGAAVVGYHPEVDAVHKHPFVVCAVFPHQNIQVQRKQHIIHLLEDKLEKILTRIVRPPYAFNLRLQKTDKVGLSGEVVTLRTGLLLCLWKPIQNSHASGDKAEKTAGSTNDQRGGGFFGTVLEGRSEEVVDLLAGFGYDALLLLLLYVEFTLEHLVGELVEDLPYLLQAIDFLQCDLVELRLDGELEVGKDSWHLVGESFADGIHGLFEGLDGPELLELLEVFVLRDEVEAVDIVQHQRHRGASEDRVLQLLPTPLFFRYPPFYLVHLHRVHYTAQGGRLRVLIPSQLSQFGGVGQWQVLYKFADGLYDGDEVGHGHLLLDYVSREDEHHSRDYFFLVIGEQGLSFEGEEGGGCSYQALQVTHNISNEVYLLFLNATINICLASIQLSPSLHLHLLKGYVVYL